MAFLAPNDFLLLEKSMGKMRRVVDDFLRPEPVIDLAVNLGSERGLLGIAARGPFNYQFVFAWSGASFNLIVSTFLSYLIPNSDKEAVSMVSNSMRKILIGMVTLPMLVTAAAPENQRLPRPPVLSDGTYNLIATQTGPQKADTKSLPEPRDVVLRERERRALITFYEALGGPDWIERDFWGSDRPVGEWHGVTTDADGRVVQLTIYDNNLTGALSPAICQLQRLHTLHLSFNKISGALPDGLGECRALKNLWLKGNKLTGRLPDPVAVLPELEYLDVHANDLSGPLPTIWNTPKLKIFRAEDNRISGPLPAQLLRQPLLEEIFIHNNELTGTIPTSLSVNLRAVLLANNKLSGPVPEEMGRLTKLTDLRLNQNQLSGPIPASLAGAQSLQVLRLDHNRLVGPIPTGLAKRLMVFDASHNPGLEPAQ